ncbi:hypothetical protein KKG81_07370 [bacterium]|nr:hypothetical protein [bacterium]
MIKEDELIIHLKNQLDKLLHKKRQIEIMITDLDTQIQEEKKKIKQTPKNNPREKINELERNNIMD